MNRCLGIIEKSKYHTAREHELKTNEIIKNLLDLDNKLRHYIIYFEDPVGKTEYKHNEEFERHIASLLTIMNIQDVYLIITMREEIYKNGFNPTGEIEPEKYVRKLNIGKRSYDYEKRKDMLLRWASVMKCKWLEDKKLKDVVLQSVKENESILPTPLNIKNFALATNEENKNVINEKDVLDMLNTQSIETAISFAQEIKLMPADKVLFLSFPFISERFSVDFVKDNYQQLVGELNIEDAWEFDRLVDWFKDDRIDISYKGYYRNGEMIRFSHPSYYEAIRFAISEKGSITEAGKTLSSVFEKLANKKDLVWDVAFSVVENYDKLPDNVQNLLFKLADNKETAWTVADAVADNFDKLPDNVRNELLVKLANKESALYDIAKAVADNFDKLPDNVRNELLVKLVDNMGSAWRDWREGYRSKEILEYVVEAIANNYGKKLPDNVRSFLFKLAYNENTASYVAKALSNNFDKLPENVRNELLVKLADNRKSYQHVVSAICNNYDKLPDNVQNLLFELANNKDAAGSLQCF